MFSHLARCPPLRIAPAFSIRAIPPATARRGSEQFMIARANDDLDPENPEPCGEPVGAPGRPPADAVGSASPPAAGEAVQEADAGAAAPLADTEATLLYEVDEQFHSLYDEGIGVTRTPERNEKRRLRFYNLIQALRSIHGLDGDVIECGAWRGLSSLLMCRYLERETPGFAGAGYHVVDSFQGLSAPGAEDVVDRDLVLKGRQRRGAAVKHAGAYAASLAQVRETLRDYPEIRYHEGWIPAVLDLLPAARYRFVHVDLDLYEPTAGALEYFYPRLVPGGLMVCDDYGSLFWPGARRAVEEFGSRHDARFLALSSGQAIFVKRGSPSGVVAALTRVVDACRRWRTPGPA